MIASLFRCSLLAVVLATSLPAVAQSTDGTMQQNSGENRDRSTKDPRTRAKVHTELGALYFQEGNIPVAMEELTVAIYIDSTYAPAYSMRALVHHFLKEPEHAETNFRDALRYAPDDPEIANNYGWFLCQNNRGEEAMPHFERALRNRLYQTPDRAYLNAGQCAMNLGKFDVARDYLDRAHRLTGGSPLVTLRLAELNFRTGIVEEAHRQLSEMMRAMEPNAEMLWLGVRVARKVGDRESEVSYATQLRRRFPASKEYQELLKGNYE